MAVLVALILEIVIVATLLILIINQQEVALAAQLDVKFAQTDQHVFYALLILFFLIMHADAQMDTLLIIQELLVLPAHPLKMDVKHVSH